MKKYFVNILHLEHVRQKAHISSIFYLHASFTQVVTSGTSTVVVLKDLNSVASKPGEGKLFSRRAALSIQELVEGQCLKSCNVILQGFKNEGLRKKRSSPSTRTEDVSIQTNNGVVALLMTASIVFGSLVRQFVATPVI